MTHPKRPLKLVCAHEAGHAVAAKMEHFEILEISVRPRLRADGTMDEGHVRYGDRRRSCGGRFCRAIAEIVVALGGEAGVAVSVAVAGRDSTVSFGARPIEDVKELDNEQFLALTSGATPLEGEIALALSEYAKGEPRDVRDALAIAAEVTASTAEAGALLDLARSRVAEIAATRRFQLAVAHLTTILPECGKLLGRSAEIEIERGFLRADTEDE